MIDEVSLDALERYVDQNRNLTMANWNCTHKSIYDKQKSFRFLPGHRMTLLNWCSEIKSNLESDDRSTKINVNHEAFSPLLREIILAALSNHNKSANARRFSEIIMNFSIYLYIHAGKSSYEMISANIPLPKAGTICKFNVICDKIVFFIEFVL